MALYDAFISYSHAKDKPLAAALQAAVQRLGKPWYRRRALRLFRDDTSLAATPHLWPTIEQALGQSRFLILLASSEAAASPWVGKEIAFWLETRGPDTLLIALTDGMLAWDHSANDFDWSERTPLPPTLKGRFAAEPKWVDLTAYRTGGDRAGARFTELAADFAAAIHGMPKEDLLSQEVRQQRRALALATAAAASLLVLTVAAATAGILAHRAQQEAVAQRDRAQQTLAAATSTADSLIFDLAQRFRKTSGVPAALVKDILDRARALQDQLNAAGELTPELLRSEAAALTETEDTLLTIGDTAGALVAADRARQIFAALVAADAANTGWQRDLSIATERVGDVLVAQAKLDEALERYRQGLAIGERLAAADRGDAQRQRDLLVAHAKIGGVLIAQRKLDEALDNYRGGLAIAERLAAAAPNDPQRQRDLSVFYGKIADVQVAQRKLTDALDSRRKEFAIVARLSSADPRNTELQRDLAISLDKVGDMLREGGGLDDALGCYRDGLAIREHLAAADPGNTQWQRDLSLSYAKLGGTLEVLGKLDEALDSYRKSLAVRTQLAAADPDNIQWQYDLGIAHANLAAIYVRQGDKAATLTELHQGRDIMARLVTLAPAAVGNDDLAWFDDQIARLEPATATKK